nr:MAG TPA: hypothetical protein [Caudoviricetes sp.]
MSPILSLCFNLLNAYSCMAVTDVTNFLQNSFLIYI